MERFLTIIEVSQKQAYIFSDNKLRENIKRSEEIAYVTGTDYIKKALDGSLKSPVSGHLVYAGGGHTILEFRIFTLYRSVDAESSAGSGILLCRS